MRNRLHAKLLTLSVFLSLTLPGLHIQAQNDSLFVFLVDPQKNVFYLDANCQAVFNPVIDTIYSVLGHTIVYPPTGVNVTATGFQEGQTVTGQQTINVVYTVGDDQGNVVFYYFDAVYLDSSPPTFTGSKPPDITINCISQFPQPLSRQATDNCMGLMNILSVDVPIPPSIWCGSNPLVVTRTWTAADTAGNLTSQEQKITVLPDNSPPVIKYPLQDMVSDCGQADYTSWISSQLAFLSNDSVTVDNCGPLSFSYFGPPSFPDTCNLSVSVLFYAQDGCGLVDTMTATFTAIDTIAPTLSGVPADTVLNCFEPVPMPATVLASDNCSTIGPDASFSETSTQTMGEGCSDFSYTVTRTWTAMDSCGNVTTRQQIITILDEVPPTFELPADTSVVCGMASLPASTGEPTALMDNCSSNVGFSFSDLIDTLSCPQEQTIRRVWSVVDECGNAAIDTQYIYVVDTVPPTFTPPADTVYVACSEAGDLNVTGMPSDIADECDSEPLAEYEQEIFDILCPNSYTIRRVWHIRDACGNADSTVQIIIVRDTIPPSFSTPAMDMSISCTTSSDAEAAFNAWIGAVGNAEAEDDCPGNSLVFFAYNAGTSLNPFLPPPGCQDTLPGVFRMQRVDFVAIDACGNEERTSATFTVLDEDPPQIVFCPADTIVATDSAYCFASLDLPPPLASELCGLEPVPYSFFQTLPITSPAPPGQELDILIDDLIFNFAVPSAPSQALGVVNVRFDLNNADADGAFEFLLVYAEDGTLLGETAHTPSQCDSSTTIFSIPSEDFNLWAQDGIVTFVLKANIPPNDLPGRFSVNNICPGGTVDARLFFQADAPPGLRFEYSINDGPRQAASLDMPVSEQFELGTSSVAYHMIDCAGNESTCIFQVSVQDIEAPLLDCPPGFTINTDPGTCQAEIPLPILAGLQDNCSVGDVISQTAPEDSLSSLITFSYSPDLMDWLADHKTLSFSGLSPIALGDVSLVIEMLGDVDAPGEYFTILDPLGNVVGTTEAGQAHVAPGDCATPSVITFNFTAAEFNAWAASGMAEFLALSNINIPIPPGGPGDGINPCDPALVAADGDNDGLSYLKATLSYVTLAPFFSASGATTLPSQEIMDITSPPAITLNKGLTNIAYEATDSFGNTGLCSFDIEVLDQEAPVALCQNTIVYINPSGAVVDTIYPNEVDLGSYDNCEIASFSVFPNLITCNAIGDTLTVFLTATDLSGNSSVCQSLIRVEGEPPLLDYATGSCGGDTLFLFATPPSQGNVFSYQWSGPNFSSSLQNPFIPNATQVNAGTYTLTIQGLTGCKSQAEIQVTIEDLPIVPTLSFASDSICSSDNIVLNTASVQAGGAVEYRWYTGAASNGTLIGTTLTPSLTLPGPHPAGSYCYYVIVIRSGCESFPSVSKCVHVTQPPTALVNEEVITLCEGEAFQLGTPVSGAGITYLWEGPGFTSTMQIPPPINNATSFNAGIYKLTIFRNGCASAPVFTIVNVLSRPATPVIFNPTSTNNPACQGDSITLLTNAVGVTSYQWTSPQFETFVTTTPSLVIENSSIQNHQGNWTLVVNDGFCPSYPSNPIFLHIAPVPNVNATSNSPVCSNLNLELTANFLAGASYSWTGPGGASYAGQSHTIPPAAGVYTVTVTSAQGCQNTSSVNVAVNQTPAITSISNNAIDCPAGPSNVTLTATFMPAYNGSNYSFLWTGGPSGNFMSTTFPGVIPNATSLNNGPYTLVVTDPNGCKSSPATTVVNMGAILPTPTQPTFAGNMPFCEGQSVVLNTIDQFSGSVEIYKWHLPGGGVLTTTGPSLQLSNLNPLTDNGNYFVVVEVDGCESDPSPISVLTINPTPQITASNNSPICEGEALELYTDCFTGNVQYAWFKAPNFSSALCNPVVPDADASNSGMYTVVVTVNGCASSPAATNVLILARPGKPVMAAISPVCLDEPGAQLTLSILPSSATPGATYLWYHETLGLIGGPTSSLALTLSDLSQFSAGLNSFYAIAQFDLCQSIPSNPVSAPFSNIPPNTANAGSDQNICEGQLLNLAATAPSLGTGHWSLTAGSPMGVLIANPDMSNTTVSGLASGATYSFAWSLSNGACLNYSSDTLDVFAAVVEQAFAGPDIDTCAINAIQLNATPPSIGSGFWNQPSGQTQLNVAILSPQNPQSVVTGLFPGNEYRFFWNLPDMGCGVKSDTVVIKVLDAQAFAGADFRTCSSGCTQLGAITPEVGFGAWSSPNPEIAFSNQLDPSATACNLSPGSNMFIWTINNGICGDAGRDTIFVDFIFEPVAQDDSYTVSFAGLIQENVSDNDFFPTGYYVNILTPPAHGVVNMSPNGAFTFIADIRFAGQDFFTYEICANGCNCSTGQVSLSIGDEAPCEIPTIITPNGDGINDYFVIPCLSDPLAFPANLVAVFNQWGDEVFRGSPYRNNWQGTFAGKDLPAGTYFFIVDFSDGSERKNGFLIIQR